MCTINIQIKRQPSRPPVPHFSTCVVDELAGVWWGMSSQKHLPGRDAPEIFLSLLDAAQVFQAQAFQQFDQAVIIC